jgi:hypothetical protein
MLPASGQPANRANNLQFNFPPKKLITTDADTTFIVEFIDE